MEEHQFPKGILPVLPVSDIDRTADYYINTLQFNEKFRQKSKDGISTDSQLSFEDSTLMINLNSEHAELEGGGVYLWVRLFERNIDEYYNHLVESEVNIVDPIRDQFWGDRSFVIKDCNNFHIAFNQLQFKQ